jgi:opacity protein-like surface antigen
MQPLRPAADFSATAFNSAAWSTASRPISITRGSNSWALYDTNFFRSETFTGSIKQTWDGSVRARAGYLVTPWILAYGTAGFAYGDVSGSFGYSAHDIFDLGYSTTGGGSWSDTRVGWTAGGGVETIISAGLTLRLEYRYIDSAPIVLIRLSPRARTTHTAVTSMMIGDAVPAVWGSGSKPSCYAKEAGICPRPLRNPSSRADARPLLQRSSPSRGAT